MGNGITEEEFKRRVKEIIDGRNKKLVQYFKAGQYEKMTGEFTLNSRIVTHEGYVIPGKDSQHYWRKVGVDLNGNNLSFKELRLDTMPLAVSEPPQDDEVDFIGVELTEFSFTSDFTSEEKEYKGYIDPPYRHRVRCDIDD